MSSLEGLLLAIDDRWTAAPGEGRIRLQILGQSALFLQTGYQRGTKDGDVLETRQVSGSVRARLETLAGRGTTLALRHGMYIDIVGAAIPLLPSSPLWHAYPLPLAHFDLVMLDVADVIVSKLIRHSSTDRDDIRAMVDGAFVDHDTLCDRLRDVLDRYQFDGRADRLATMIDRFHAIERDLFVVEETPFEVHPSALQ